MKAVVIIHAVVVMKDISEGFSVGTSEADILRECQRQVEEEPSLVFDHNEAVVNVEVYKV